MASQSEGLLSRIQQGVVDLDVPVSSLLNMCLILGGQAKSEKMRDWARKELHGYPAGAPEDFPTYRRIPAVITIRITNLAGYNPITQNLRNAELPSGFTDRFNTEELVLGQDVSRLEALVRSDDQSHYLSPPWAPLLCQTVNRFGMRPGSQVTEAFWVVKRATFEGVLGRVRSALADLVAELVALTPDNQEIPATSAADAVTIFLFTGDRHVINTLHQQAADGGANTAVNSFGDGPATAVGSQTTGENSSVVGNQVVGGTGNTVTGRDTTTTPADPAAAREGWWIRLRKRGVVVAISTILGGIAGIIAAAAAVWTLAGWPWPFS